MHQAGCCPHTACSPTKSHVPDSAPTLPCATLANAQSSPVCHLIMHAQSCVRHQHSLGAPPAAMHSCTMRHMWVYKQQIYETTRMFSMHIRQGSS